MHAQRNVTGGHVDGGASAASGMLVDASAVTDLSVALHTERRRRNMTEERVRVHPAPLANLDIPGCASHFIIFGFDGAQLRDTEQLLALKLEDLSSLSRRMQVRQQQKFELVALSLQLTKLVVCLLLNQQLEADNKLQVELEAESQKTFEHFGAEVCIVCVCVWALQAWLQGWHGATHSPHMLRLGR